MGNLGKKRLEPQWYPSGGESTTKVTKIPVNSLHMTSSKSQLCKLRAIDHKF